MGSYLLLELPGQVGMTSVWLAERRDGHVNCRLVLKLPMTACSCVHVPLVVHRELMPANVLVDAAGDAHLLDVGVAKLFDEQPDRQLTRQMERGVTPDDAAPEQLGSRPITIACDVKSLGVLLYAIVIGDPPVASPEPAATMPLFV